MPVMFIWRQTSAALQRSVHTASTACALSIALWLWLGRWRGLVDLVVFSGLLLFLVEVISQFLGGLVLRVLKFEFEFSFFGAQDDRLALHAADHIKRSARLSAQRHLQKVFLDAGLDRLAQRALDLEEAIGRAQPADALVGTLVVIMFDPEADALTRGLKTFELRARQKLLPKRRPEALDFAQRHRVLRTRLEMRHAILLQLRLEARSATPRSILPAIIREHLLRWLILRDGLPIHFDHRLRRRTAEQIRPHDKARVIIQERNHVGVTPTQPEREDVRLPHLIGRGPLKKTRARHVALARRGWR